jgi:uncharacterized OB-fold protein
MANTQDPETLLEIPVFKVYPYRYSTGRLGTYFFRELRENRRIHGRQCPGCGAVYVPPRPVCGPCWTETDRWVEVGPEGTLEAFTVVYFSFLDPMTGKARPVPYGYGMIRLDGATSRMQHFLQETDLKRLFLGQRVRARFREERVGKLTDIEHFEILPGRKTEDP